MTTDQIVDLIGELNYQAAECGVEEHEFSYNSAGYAFCVTFGGIVIWDDLEGEELTPKLLVQRFNEFKDRINKIIIKPEEL